MTADTGGNVGRSMVRTQTVAATGSGATEGTIVRGDILVAAMAPYTGLHIRTTRGSANQRIVADLLMTVGATRDETEPMPIMQVCAPHNEIL
jgi:hypothetical protein